MASGILPYKEEKSLFVEMEIVSTDLAIALWRDEIIN